jgi:hypothetical protein
MGDRDNAIAKYQNALESERHSSPYMIQFHYRLGLLCEEKKDFHASGEAYRRFLSFWKDADPDIPMLVDAKKRLANLEGQARSRAEARI